MSEKMSIRAWATGGRFGSGVYEIHQGGRYVGYVSVERLRNKGLVKRIDHTKRAVEFLNTDEGREWFEKAKFH